MSDLVKSLKTEFLATRLILSMNAYGLPLKTDSDLHSLPLNTDSDYNHTYYIFLFVSYTMLVEFLFNIYLTKKETLHIFI